MPERLQAGGLDRVHELQHGHAARGGEDHLHARAGRRVDGLADEGVIEDRLLERHGDGLGRLEADRGLALGLVLDERHVEQADDAVPDGQAQVHATSEVALAEQLAQRLGELLGLGTPTSVTAPGGSSTLAAATTRLRSSATADARRESMCRPTCVWDFGLKSLRGIGGPPDSPFGRARCLCLRRRNENWTPLDAFTGPSTVRPGLTRESPLRARSVPILAAMPSTQPNTPAGIPNPASPERREQVEARLAGLIEPAVRDRPDRRIGDVIAELGFAKREVVEAAVELARRSGELTGEVLINSGVITAEQLSRALAERHGLEYIDFSVFTPDMGAANLIDANAAKRYSGGPGRLPRRAHAARRDGRPGEHPRDRRHLDDDRATTSIVRSRREEDVTAVIAHIDRVEHHIGIETDVEEAAAPAPVTDLEAPDRGRAGRPARPLGDRRGDRARRERHPLRPDRRAT